MANDLGIARKKRWLTAEADEGGEERQLVPREISVSAARNKRLSVDDSDFERTDYREGSINVGGKRGKKSGRAGYTSVQLRETSGTYFEVARQDFLHLLVHHADEFAGDTIL